LPAAVFQDIPSIAVADLYRKGAWCDDRPTEGGGRFADGATVEWSVTPSKDRVFGHTKITGVTGRSLSGEVAIDVSWSLPHLGGRRAWFLCPRCLERRSRLFFKDDEFRCRNCAKVSYGSQHQSAELRKLARAAEIRRRLGGLPEMGAQFPERPARMHFKTYFRLRDEALALEEEVRLDGRARYFAFKAAGRHRSAAAMASELRLVKLSAAEADDMPTIRDIQRAMADILRARLAAQRHLG
jgi:hypothetical protein